MPHVAPRTARTPPPLQTVKRSLEYWQRTVQWLTNPAINTSVEMTPPRGNASGWRLVEQANIWQALVLGAGGSGRIQGRSPRPALPARCGGVVRGHRHKAGASECRRPGRPADRRYPGYLRSATASADPEYLAGVDRGRPAGGCGPGALVWRLAQPQPGGHRYRRAGVRRAGRARAAGRSQGASAAIGAVESPATARRPRPDGHTSPVPVVTSAAGSGRSSGRGRRSGQRHLHRGIRTGL